MTKTRSILAFACLALLVGCSDSGTEAPPAAAQAVDCAKEMEAFVTAQAPWKDVHRRNAEAGTPEAKAATLAEAREMRPGYEAAEARWLSVKNQCSAQ